MRPPNDLIVKHKHELFNFDDQKVALDLKFQRNINLKGFQTIQGDANEAKRNYDSHLKKLQEKIKNTHIRLPSIEENVKLPLLNNAKP